MGPGESMACRAAGVGGRYGVRCCRDCCCEVIGMPFLALDGCDLYYELYGRGPALVFAHGARGNDLSWWQQVPYFQERYTCLTFAHRGFGRSREVEDGPGPAAFVDDLAALLDHLGFEEVRLVAQ